MDESWAFLTLKLTLGPRTSAEAAVVAFSMPSEICAAVIASNKFSINSYGLAFEVSRNASRWEAGSLITSSVGPLASMRAL